MGLDSVELILEFEKYFNIKISDAEAEKIITIQDSVDLISRSIHFVLLNRDIKLDIFKSLKQHLEDLKPGISILREALISEIMSKMDENEWRLIETKMNYQLLYNTTPKTHLGKLIEKYVPKSYDFSNTTIDRYVDLICSTNYKTILSHGEVSNKYEVLIAVMGISIDKLGLDPLEVYANKSYVKDFGVN